MGREKSRPRSLTQPPISMGAVVQESLPLPFVYYPKHYGTFFAFARDETAPPMLCACSEAAVQNLLRFESMSVDEQLQPLRLGSRHFPDIMADLTYEQLLGRDASTRFEMGLCHRCNLVTPSLRWCHEMYGTRFVQYYGWYIQQAYLRLGILGSRFLAGLCPSELQADIIASSEASDAVRVEYEWFRTIERHVWDVVTGAPPLPIDYHEVACHQERLRRAQRHSEQTRRKLTTKVENLVRQEFGFRKVGEGWVSETLLHQLVCRVLGDEQVLRHYRPEWMEGLELDLYVPSRRLAIEYQGQQHFHPVKAWGGEAALKAVQARDARKAEICKQLGIRLISFDYTEPLTEEHVHGVLFGCMTC